MNALAPWILAAMSLCAPLALWAAKYRIYLPLPGEERQQEEDR